MKKIATLVICFILAFSICGCSCNKEEPIVLTETQYVQGEGKIDYLDSYDTIQTLIDNKENFAFYVYNNGCLGCLQFTPRLYEYVKNNGINMYAITYIKLSEYDSELAELLQGTPGVVIYKDGALYKYLSSYESDHKEYFGSSEGFQKWFETYVTR